MKKISIILMVVCLILGLGGLFVWRLYTRVEAVLEENNQQKNKSQAVAVESVPVVRDEIRDIRTFTGTLQPRARFIFAPKIAGRLEELAVNIGDVVKPGQLIARIDDEEYVQEVNRAKAALAVEQAAVEQQMTNLTLARREMERIKALRAKKVASEAEWDQADAEYKAKAAQLKVAEAQMAEQKSALKAAEVRLSYTRIAAPTDDPIQGTWRVEERFVDVGAMLAANTSLVSVVDLSSMTAVVYVIERDYPSISLGLQVAVTTDAYPKRTFSGKVMRIAPVLRESSRQARIEIEIPNQDLALRPGMFIRASMEFAHHENARLVPRSALVKRDDKDGIFVVDEKAGVALFKEVELGIIAGDQAEIVSPELSGKVITLGQHLLSDKTPIMQIGRGGKKAENKPDGKTDAKPDSKPDANEKKAAEPKAKPKAEPKGKAAKTGGTR